MAAAPLSSEEDASAPDAQLSLVRPMHASLKHLAEQDGFRLWLGRMARAGPAAGACDSARVFDSACVTPKAGRLGAPGSRKAGVCACNAPGRLPPGQPLAQSLRNFTCVRCVCPEHCSAPAMFWRWCGVDKTLEVTSSTESQNSQQERRFPAVAQAQRRSSPEHHDDDMQLQFQRGPPAMEQQPTGVDYVAAGAAPDQTGQQQQHIITSAAAEASASEALTASWQLRSLRRRFASQRERSAQGRPPERSASADAAVLDMSGAQLGAGEVPLLAVFLSAEATCAGLSLRGCMLGSTGLQALLAALAAGSGCPAGAQARSCQCYCKGLQRPERQSFHAGHPLLSLPYRLLESTVYESAWQHRLLSRPLCSAGPLPQRPDGRRLRGPPGGAAAAARAARAPAAKILAARHRRVAADVRAWALGEPAPHAPLAPRLASRQRRRQSGCGSAPGQRPGRKAAAPSKNGRTPAALRYVCPHASRKAPVVHSACRMAPLVAQQPRGLAVGLLLSAHAMEPLC